MVTKEGVRTASKKNCITVSLGNFYIQFRTVKIQVFKGHRKIKCDSFSG